MSPIPFVVTTRGFADTGYTVENLHHGSVAVVDTSGALLWSAGDPHAMTFTRSAIKPFQALPFLQADGPARFGFSRDELAMLCASHSGEAMHVAVVESMLDKIGLDETCLACGCHAPLYYDSVGQAAPAGPWRQVHHNCSGKHTGFLAWCRLQGAAIDGYLDRGHALQQAVRATLAEVAGVPAAAMPVGLDGCSAPNYALPLSRLAHMYARLAQGAADPVLGAHLGDLFDAMTARPDLVSGQARCDLAYMQAGAGDWVSKVGADAVQTIGIRSAGLGIAIKLADGGTRSLQTATFAVLDQLGLLDARQRTLLDPYRAPPLLNVRGAMVGEINAVFKLQPAATASPARSTTTTTTS